MTIVYSQFIVDYPEFANAQRYPQSLINYWLTDAYALLNPAAWSTYLDTAAELYCAHNITIERRAMDEGTLGASIVGAATGPVSAKGVDKVSTAYAVELAGEAGAGYWNLSTYGQRLYRRIQMFGMGPMLIGAGCCDGLFLTAWAGPIPWPGWFC